MAQTENNSNQNLKYRVLLLADVNSSHTQKWALSLAEKGIEVGIFSLAPLKSDWIKDRNNIQILHAPRGINIHPYIAKILSIFTLQQLKYAIEDFNPAIVHAHYASSYGLLGALSGFHPFILSVWGSDVFSFPHKSALHKWILKFNLKRADKICSTSHVMKKEIQKYTDKDITVIPFGVDLNVFKPFYAPHVFKENTLLIGTIKHLEKEYGIEYLIDAFVLLRKKLKAYSLKLLIVGDGSLEKELKEKVKDLGMDSEVVFTGHLPPEEIPFYQNMLTIPVFPSLHESFGVSAVEAMACEKPVVVTNVGGLSEVVEDRVTGLIVPPANAEKLAEAIEELIVNTELRAKLGKQGREHVERLYKWDENLASMMEVYREVLAEKVK